MIKGVVLVCNYVVTAWNNQSRSTVCYITDNGKEANNYKKYLQKYRKVYQWIKIEEVFCG